MVASTRIDVKKHRSDILLIAIPKIVVLLLIMITLMKFRVICPIAEQLQTDLVGRPLHMNVQLRKRISRRRVFRALYRPSKCRKVGKLVKGQK